MIIEFRNTFLKSMLKEDQGKILMWRKKKEISKYMLTDIEANTLEDQNSWFKKISEDKSCKYWVIYNGDRPVGVANLSEIDIKEKKTNWAFYVAESNSSLQGVGAKVEFMIINYVFFKMNFKNLLCQVLSNNPKVVELHKKFGFHHYKTEKLKYNKNNEQLDMFFLTMSKDQALEKKYDQKPIRYTI
tara:strand:- start:4663 stop:5223 length:561 start_codon:yes stop_codon:yes gene_type:complete